jgi:hypothetical protein
MHGLFIRQETYFAKNIAQRIEVGEAKASRPAPPAVAPPPPKKKSSGGGH